MTKVLTGVDTAIVGYVGGNGGGKSLAMTEDLAVPWLDDHTPCDCGECDGIPRTIVANYGIESTNFVPLRSWRQVVLAHNARILLDEISAVLPSRQAMTVPPQLVRVINQLRKQNCQLGWTAPAWARCDSALREVTRTVCVCRGFWRDPLRRVPGVYRFPRRGPLYRGPDGRPVKAGGWVPNCLFTCTYFDSKEFDDVSYDQLGTLKPAAHKFYWRPANKAYLVYRTMQGVDLMDHLDDVGACFMCGGTRSRKRCSCALESPFEPPVDVGQEVVAGSVEVAGPGRADPRGARFRRPVGGRPGGQLVDAGGLSQLRGGGRPGGDGAA